MPAMADEETKWLAIVAEYRQSGLTAVEFSQQRQVSVHSLRHWSGRLKLRPELSKGVRLARVVRGAETSEQIVIERAGARVAVAPGFDRATLRAVLEVLAEIAPT